MVISFNLIAEREKIDSSEIPSVFTVSFDWSEWKRVLKKKDGVYKFSDNYGDIIQKKFNETNPMCVLTMNKKVLIEPGHPKYGLRNFLGIYTSCKGKNCSARYSFTLKEAPCKEDNDVVLTVRYDDESMQTCSRAQTLFYLAEWELGISFTAGKRKINGS